MLAGRRHDATGGTAAERELGVRIVEVIGVE